MGWLFTYGASRKDVIAEVIADHERSRTLRHCTRGNVLWILRETTPPATEATIRFIICVLLQRGTEGWGFKDMDESMGPCYYTCPLVYLDEATEPVNKYAAEWRDAVREHHKAAKAKRAAQPKQQTLGVWVCVIPSP